MTYLPMTNLCHPQQNENLGNALQSVTDRPSFGGADLGMPWDFYRPP